MTVITSEQDKSTLKVTEDHCTICRAELHPPFLEWVCKSSLYFCGACCRQIKDGMMADLIQVSAITELQAVGVKHGPFNNSTLIRQDTRHHDESERQRWARLMSDDDDDGIVVDLKR